MLLSIAFDRFFATFPNIEAFIFQSTAQTNTDGSIFKKRYGGIAIKAIKYTASLLSLVLILPQFMGAASGEAYSFYCMRRADHARPSLEKEFSFIEEYDGYYIGKKDEKVIYLTFDAGYENGNVERILDTLKKHNAHGAFFILDNLIRRNTELVCRMANEGHEVCNHTARHKDMTKMTSREEFEKELTSLSSVYNELTGKTMEKFFRPPEGKFSLQSMKYASCLGYKTIFWSFAYADWDNEKQPDAQKAIDLIMKNTHDGMVILLHPTSKTNADILDTLLTRWENDGYTFGTLKELCEE